MPCSPGPGHKASGRSTFEASSRTAFTHRDSRAGDPDLHTHVAVANKVQTLDGRWLSIDGRVLFRANVAASETYNTALEQHLRNTIGARAAGPGPPRPTAHRPDMDGRRWHRSPHPATVAGHQDPAVTARYLHPDVQAMLDAGTAFSTWWSVAGPERPQLGVIEGGENVG